MNKKRVKKWFVFEEDGERTELPIAPGTEAHIMPLGTLDELKAQLTEARAELKLVEWVNADHWNARLGCWCPRCLGIPPPYGIGHSPDCRLDKALG